MELEEYNYDVAYIPGVTRRKEILIQGISRLHPIISMSDIQHKDEVIFRGVKDG